MIDTIAAEVGTIKALKITIIGLQTSIVKIATDLVMLVHTEEIQEHPQEVPTTLHQIKMQVVIEEAAIQMEDRAMQVDLIVETKITTPTLITIPRIHQTIIAQMQGIEAVIGIGKEIVSTPIKEKIRMKGSTINLGRAIMVVVVLIKTNLLQVQEAPLATLELEEM
jgi:hypothetical protein